MLYIKKKSGRYQPATPQEIFAKAARLRVELNPPGTLIQSPADAHELLRENLAHLPHEMFACLFLDTRHRLLRYEELFRGTIDGAAVYPREIVKLALRLNAAAVILAHNHPSGVAEPS